MKQENLIFTLSGIRGIAEKDFDFNIVKKISIAYGSWLESTTNQVIVGRDTRPSSKFIEKAVIEGLIAVGLNITNVGVCPTPIIIHAKKSLNIPGGIIITGSHNPQQWNGLKLLSANTFLNNDDIKEISAKINKVDLNLYPSTKHEVNQHTKNLNPIQNYIQDLTTYIDYEKIKKRNDLSVVIDTGAGAGKIATPQVLNKIGCKVKVINNDLLVNDVFPREIEPIEENLKDLIMEVWQGNHDIGFAHDSDADRLAIIGESGIYYPEDIGLALITDFYLKKFFNSDKEIIFITNLASSLRFEVLAKKYNAEVIRTRVGERFLAEKMEILIKEESIKSTNRLVFGGEGSCGGFMFPYFNNTRDGIFAAVKIVEILVRSEKKISDLIARLPKFYSQREKVNIENKDTKQIIDLVKHELIEEGEHIIQYDLDLRFGKGMEWFVLIHPSNTEQVIRIISEAKRESLARIYCEATAELVRLVIKTI
ncbi:MAG: hypothetical protein ACFFB0_10805 [Promethearchaeota archaeon]